MFQLSCDVLNQCGYNLLLTITCGFTLSRDTSPFLASLIIVWPVVAFLSSMDDSFLGSVATKTMMTLKSTFTLPFLEEKKQVTFSSSKSKELAKP